MNFIIILSKLIELKTNFLTIILGISISLKIVTTIIKINN